MINVVGKVEAMERAGISMAYVLKSALLIGAIYAASPVRNDTSDLMRLADKARSATSATQMSRELANLSGEPALVALRAARSWAALDEASKAELRRLIADTTISMAMPPGAVGGASRSAPVRKERS